MASIDKHEETYGGDKLWCVQTVEDVQLQLIVVVRRSIPSGGDELRDHVQLARAPAPSSFSTQ